MVRSFLTTLLKISCPKVFFLSNCHTVCRFPPLWHSYKTFHQPKWHKAKKQLPLIHIEVFEQSQTHKITSFRLFWYLRTHLTNGGTKIKWDNECTDAHRPSSTPWWPDAQKLSVVPREEVWRGPTAALGAHCLYKSSMQNKCWMLFLLYTFFHKSKSPSQISFS